MSKLTELRKKFDDVSKTQLSLEEQITKLKEDLTKKVQAKFKGIKINLSHDEFGIKITLGDTFILEHLYNDTGFENIDKSLYNEVIALYENVYGEPIEKPQIFDFVFSNCSWNLKAPTK